ncbi:hypothetical protein [Saccharopolyspora mangrovi]|uniref:Glycosyltransferase RgtA/B/C/D-like domain-containing protein n=1 Tax=Saccharopolyspora mangrovi TaxID=3082379 RepID=A0ABU6AE37_9PSEU|nr:hypothetical protein [Saccharopolyspora sp. S2-29]MEB3369822.1 hypothetical protein [Saccharopolyspora sp. S2-29]
MVKSEIEPEAALPPLSSRSRRFEWFAAGFGAAVGALVMVLVHRALADDVWITLGYVRNLAEHGHWGLLPDRPSNTQTSPLNAWLLTGIFLVVGRPVVTVGLLLIAVFALIGWWTAKIARGLGLSAFMPVLVVALLASSPLLISATGMETYLGIAILLGIARCALQGKRWPAAVLWGLAVLVRPDLVVPAGVLLALLLWPHLSRKWLGLVQAAAVGALIALPWHLFSWYALGGFVPDSTFIKVTSPGSVTMLDAAFRFFYVRLPGPTILSAVPVVAGLLCAAWAWRERRRAWARVALVSLLAGWVHWAALALVGAFPEAWYFAPVVAGSILTTSIVLAQIRNVISYVAALAFAAVCLVSSGPLPWSTMPLVLNHAQSGQYQRIAIETAELTGGQQVRAPGEIGALSYFSGGRIVDHFGDPWMIKVVLDEHYAQAGELEKKVLRWNWQHLPDPTKPQFAYALSFRSAVPEPPGQVLRTWQVDTPARGHDVIELVRLGPAGSLPG